MRETKVIFEIRSFLGLAGYYRRFIEDFSWLAAPMTRLTRKEVKFVWDDSCEQEISGIEKEAYFSSYSNNPGNGTEIHNVL